MFKVSAILLATILSLGIVGEASAHHNDHLKHHQKAEKRALKEHQKDERRQVKATGEDLYLLNQHQKAERRELKRHQKVEKYQRSY